MEYQQPYESSFTNCGNRDLQTHKYYYTTAAMMDVASLNWSHLQPWLHHNSAQLVIFVIHHWAKLAKQWVYNQWGQIGLCAHCTLLVGQRVEWCKPDNFTHHCVATGNRLEASGSYFGHFSGLPIVSQATSIEHLGLITTLLDSFDLFVVICFMTRRFFHWGGFKIAPR